MIIVIRRGQIVVIVVDIAVMHGDAGETVGHRRMMMGHNVVGQRCDLAVVEQLVCRRHAAHCYGRCEG